jgi:N-acetylmuramoyl-L-alanine amidase
VTELTAELCLQLGLDPETDVIRHYDVTGKDCPKYYVEHPEAWNAFRADTAAELRKLQALKAK